MTLIFNVPTQRSILSLHKVDHPFIVYLAADEFPRQWQHKFKRFLSEFLL